MRCARPGAAALALVLFASPGQAVPSVPASFVVEDVAPGAALNTPVGITFMQDGRMLVAEKRGRVYAIKNGSKYPTPMWAGENEVLNNGDRGLLSVAVDPNYPTNHFIYLLYTVDPDSNGTDDNVYAFGRLTRYQISATDSNVVDYTTRTVLMGTDWRHGPASASDSHTIGSLRWGSDGSLLVSVGDGGHYEYMDQGGNDGPQFGAAQTDPNEDIGAFRAQYIGCLPGKILRINPLNGHGYASNPFVNGNLASYQSRIWAYGLRNPYRFTLRPNTGTADTSSASPGTLYIGDVGWVTWEEMNIARTPGLNFGWPCFEGIGAQSQYQAATPAHNGCGSMGTPSNPSFQSAPLATWNHTTDALSVPPGFHGNTSIGGAFYTSNQYPAQYRGQYFFGDYGQSWVKCAVVDGNDNLIQILNFGTAMDGPVDFALEPGTGNILYVAINVGQVRRIRWTGAVGGNTQPIASISASPLGGSVPLTVNFSGSGSIDADNDPLTYSWAFGDGATGSGITTNHTYTTSGAFTAQLTVTDGRGGLDVKIKTIMVSPPGAGFPSSAVLDNFNRANGAIGGSWVDVTSGLSINSNALIQTSSTNTTVWNGATFGPNQEAYITLAAITPSSPEQNLMLKVQGTSWSAGHIEVAYNAQAGQVFVNTYAPGQGWVGRGSIAPLSFAAGDQFGARADSVGNLFVYKNGVQQGQVALGNWPFIGNGGRLGLTLTGATTTRFDDFGGGNMLIVTNTKPTASISTPVNNAFYVKGQIVLCSGDGTDAQSPSDSLHYDWVVDLHHNTHVHPATFSFSGKTGSFTADNYDDGTGVHLEVKLAVTDPGGLSDTARVNIWPETDLQPSAVIVTPDPPTATQSAQYDFKLYNTGRLPAPISHWVLRAGNNLIAQGDTIVAALDSVTISRSAAAPAAGTYALRLTADSANVVFETNESNNASVRSLTINPLPGNHAPTAAAAGAPTGGLAPLAVNFSAAGSSDIDGDPLSYAWAFGDGGTGSGLTTSHTYAAAGNFTAVVTVSDGRGGAATANVVIAVTAPATGFPQTAVLDNFNRANGAIGGSWVDVTSGLVINANRLTQTSSTNTTVWNGATFGTNQEEFITFATEGGAAEQNLMLKVQGTSWSAGHIEVAYDAAGGKVWVTTYAPSQGWVGRGSLNASFASGDQFGARADSVGNVSIYKNGTKLGQLSVGNWPFAANTGRLGLTITGANTTFFDDFGGGTVTGAPPVLPDLQVSAVTVVPDPPAATQSAQYGFKLYNRGAANAGTSHWMLRAGATLLGQGDAAVAAQDSASLSVNAAIAAAGTYVLRLVADSLAAVTESNETNNASVRALTVGPAPVNHPPVAVASGAPQSGQASLLVNFSGAGSSDSDGDPLTYAWVFGDGGSGSGLTVSHTYAAAGNFAAILTVTDGRGGVDTASVAVSVSPAPGNNPPVAVASGAPQSGQASLLVNFSGAGSSDPDSDPLAYAWAFGDGGTGSGLTISHTYVAAGNYAAILTVTDGRGGSDTASVAVSVSAPPVNHPPVAVAAGTPQSGQTPLPVNFSGAGSSDPDSDPLTYAWAFGDGGSGSGLTISHTYASIGNYAAILTVADGRGGVDTASVAVSVSAPPNTFPQTAVLDDFNRANGAVGGSWTPGTGLTISGNQLKPTAHDISSVWNGGVFGPNQEAYITLSAITNNAPEHNLMLKVQGLVWSTGHIEVSYDHRRHVIQVNTYDPAVGWVGRGAAISVTMVAGDRLGARALSDGTVTVYRNGTAIGLASVAGWAYGASGGRLGLTLTGAQNSTLDNFGGGDVAGPAPLARSEQAPAAEDASRLAAPPTRIALSSPYPNPSGARVSFALDLPRAGRVDFAVLDIQGREVWSAPGREYGAGRWTLDWDGRTAAGAAVSPGVYLVRVGALGETFMRRVAMLR